MNPKSDPKVADPGAGYAETAGQTVKPDTAPLTSEQQGFLREVLADLAELDEYAAEHDVPPPAPVAIEAAKAFLHQAVREAPRHYAVCPWTEGAAVVYTQSKNKIRMDIFFEADDSASCFIIHPRSTETEIRQFFPAAKVANKEVFDVLREMKG